MGKFIIKFLIFMVAIWSGFYLVSRTVDGQSHQMVDTDSTQTLTHKSFDGTNTFSGLINGDASTLLNKTWASPGGIGSNIPSSGAFTTLTAVSVCNQTTFIVVTCAPFNAIGDSVTDNAAAFSSAGSSASYVEVHVPAGSYRLNSNPTPSGSVVWVLDYGTTFTGNGSLPGKIISFGAVGQDTVLTVLDKLTSGSNTLSAVRFIVADGTEGNVTGPFSPSADAVVLHTLLTSSAARQSIFGIFSELDLMPGFPAYGVAIMANTNQSSGTNATDPGTATSIIGFEAESGGSWAPGAAYSTVSTTTSNRWKHGLWFDSIGGQSGSTLIKANNDVSIDYGLDLRNAAIAIQGIAIGGVAPQKAGIGVRQYADGENAIFLQRFTDTNPTGNFLENVNQANNTVISSMRANGDFYTVGQYGSTLATGTPPISVSSTTPAPNLNAYSVTYDNTGSQRTNQKENWGTTSLVNGSQTVTFTSTSTYSASTAYTAGAITQATSATKPLTIVKTSGSTLTIYGLFNETVDWWTKGN